MAIRVGDPDPFYHLMNGVGIGEDVVGRLPVGVLVGAAEASHPERRRVGKGAAKVAGSGPGSDCRLESIHDRNRVVAEERAGERRMIRPAAPASTGREQARELRCHRMAQGDEIRRLTPSSRFFGAARGNHLTDHGRQHRCSVLPADQVEALERLIDEVE